jgi:hypothetical protein
VASDVRPVHILPHLRGYINRCSGAREMRGAEPNRVSSTFGIATSRVECDFKRKFECSELDCEYTRTHSISSQLLGIRAAVFRGTHSHASGSNVSRRSKILTTGASLTVGASIISRPWPSWDFVPSQYSWATFREIHAQYTLLDDVCTNKHRMCDL